MIVQGHSKWRWRIKTEVANVKSRQRRRLLPTTNQLNARRRWIKCKQHFFLWCFEITNRVCAHACLLTSKTSFGRSLPRLEWPIEPRQPRQHWRQWKRWGLIFFVFAICEQTPQTDKWVLKQLRDQRFQIGDRSFATYVLTPREVAYYTLLAEGDEAVLQVCDMFITLATSSSCFFCR